MFHTSPQEGLGKGREGQVTSPPPAFAPILKMRRLGFQARVFFKILASKTADCHCLYQVGEHLREPVLTLGTRLTGTQSPLKGRPRRDAGSAGQAWQEPPLPPALRR